MPAPSGNVTKRFPLVLPADNRDSSTTKDAKLVNCYIERNEATGDFSLFKRPGLRKQSTVAASTTGAGVYNWEGHIYSVFNSALYKDGVSVGTVNSTGGIYYFSSIIMPIPALVLTNGVQMYMYDNTNGLRLVPPPASIATNGQFTAGSAVVTQIPSTAGMVSGWSLTGYGIPTGATILSVDSATQITMSVPATQTSVTAGSHTYTATVQMGTIGTTYTTIAKYIYNISGTGTTGMVVGNGVTITVTVSGPVYPIYNQGATYNITAINSGSSLTENSPYDYFGPPLDYGCNITTTTIAVPFSFTAFYFGLDSPKVKGIATLDTTTYQMDSSAKIVGSGLNDPLTWNPTNSITAQIEPDGGVRLAKSLAYVIAFKQWTTEVFYDAANATGSPLGLVPGVNPQYGCAAATSVVRIEGVLYWVSTTRSGSLGVHKLDNLSLAKISTKAIDRLISDIDTTVVYAFGLRDAGHLFYVVTFKNSNLTLAYDIGEGQWSQWTDTNGNYLPLIDATYLGTSTLVQHESNGNLYYMEVETYADDGALFSVDAVTPNFDAGVKIKKQLNRMEIVSDQETGGILSIRNSDDDYRTWSNYRQVDLSKKNAYLTNCGSFYKRAYHFHYRANAPLRLQGVELTYEEGTL